MGTLLIFQPTPDIERQLENQQCPRFPQRSLRSAPVGDAADPNITWV
jgi:hypothetical protein